MIRATAYTIGSVLLTSSIALVCLVTLGWDEAKLRKRIPMMIALTVGILLGEALFHLLPEAVRIGIPIANTLGLTLGGIAFSYGIEVACRAFLSGPGPAPVARISLFAESVHNAIDGAIIAAAYIAGIQVGVIATLAVLLHELPHELGNFSVLVHGGYERKKAFLLNCYSACAAFLGAVAVIIAGPALSTYARDILPAAAGCFIYIAAFDLLPSLWKDYGRTNLPRLSGAVAAGGAFMLILSFAR